MSITRPHRAASFWIAPASRALSTDSIIATNGAMYLILLVCKWPIMCHSISFGSASYFSRSSCGRLSPKRRCPAS